MPSLFGFCTLVQAALALRRRSKASSVGEAAEERVPWHLNKIHREQASFTGKGVHVYVMTSGIRVTHQEFGGRAIATLDTTLGGRDAYPDIPYFFPVECTAEIPDCAADKNDLNSFLGGSGTKMAGLVGGSTYGVAPESVIHAVKVGGPLRHKYNALDWIAKNAQRPAAVAAFKSGMNEFDDSRLAFEAVVNSGIAVIVGASSNGKDACSGADGIIPAVIGVGPLTWKNEPRERAGYGRCIDIWAPGEDLLTTSNKADDATRTTFGSENTAALVAGAAALLLEADPSLTPEEVRQALRGTATTDVLKGQRNGDSNLLLNVGPLGATPAPGTECPTECNWLRCFRASCKVCHFC